MSLRRPSVSSALAWSCAYAGLAYWFLHFLGVFFQIKKLPLILALHARIVDEFVGGCADADHLRQVVVAMAIEVVIGCVANFFGLAFQDAAQGMALNVIRDGQAGVVEQGGGEVDVVTHRGADLPCLDDLRKANQERLVQGFFIHPLLVVEAVLTEGEALVRCVDDDGAVGEAALVQVVEDAADIVIHVF